MRSLNSNDLEISPTYYFNIKETISNIETQELLEEDEYNVSSMYTVSGIPLVEDENEFVRIEHEFIDADPVDNLKERFTKIKLDHLLYIIKSCDIF